MTAMDSLQNMVHGTERGHPHSDAQRQRRRKLRRLSHGICNQRGTGLGPARRCRNRERRQHVRYGRRHTKRLAHNLFRQIIPKQIVEMHQGRNQMRSSTLGKRWDRRPASCFRSRVGFVGRSRVRTRFVRLLCLPTRGIAEKIAALSKMKSHSLVLCPSVMLHLRVPPVQLFRKNSSEAHSCLRRGT